MGIFRSAAESSRTIFYDACFVLFAAPTRDGLHTVTLASSHLSSPELLNKTRPSYPTANKQNFWLY